MVYAKSNSQSKSNKLLIAGDLSSEEEMVKQGTFTKSTVKPVVVKREPSPLYKPIKAETNLFSAYSIKPSFKKDAILAKNIINAKYTISKKAEKKLSNPNTNSPGANTVL